MAWTRFVCVAYGLCLLAANICMADLALAIAPSSGTHDVLMSRMDKEECPFLRMSQAPWPPDKASPCESGQCLTTPPLETPCFTHGAVELTAASLSMGTPVQDLILPPSTEPSIPLPTESPPLPSGVRTVVLRR